MSVKGTTFGGALKVLSFAAGLGVSSQAVAGESAGENDTPLQRPDALASAVAAKEDGKQTETDETDPPASRELAAADEANKAEPLQPTSSPAPLKPSQRLATRTPAADSSLPPPGEPTELGRQHTKPDIEAKQGWWKRGKDLPHKGFTMDFRIGTQGCVRAVCSSSRHDAGPGLRLDGFLGSNIRGWVDLGISGGWGTLSANVDNGTNALDLYGVDSQALTAQLEESSLGLLDFDLNSLSVTDAQLRTAQVGPLVRVHFIPRGRVAAYVGSGVQYSLFRAKYDTPQGDVRFDFHGLAVPIEAGGALFVAKNIAVGVQFDYLWTWYGLTSIDHPLQSATLPLRILEEVDEQSSEIRRDLPQLWTLTFAARARF